MSFFAVVVCLQNNTRYRVLVQVLREFLRGPCFSFFGANHVCSTDSIDCKTSTTSVRPSVHRTVVFSQNSKLKKVSLTSPYLASLLRRSHPRAEGKDNKTLPHFLKDLRKGLHNCIREEFNFPLPPQRHHPTLRPFCSSLFEPRTMLRSDLT